ncbi:MAG: hypothetical protein ACRBFS_15585 [Aureispira sp.]
MKITLFFYTVLILLLGACQSNTPTEKASKKATTTDKTFYLELVTTATSINYDQTLTLVQKALFNNGYVFDKRVKKVDGSEKKGLIIHRFKAKTDDNSNEEGIEKIVLTLKEPNEEGLHNFSYRSYKKQGNDWQSVFNPGNFRYPKEQSFEETKFANWITERVVLLTYKSNPITVAE